jgi:uncharacterized protein YggE
MDHEILVRGTAEVRVPPDRALAYVTIDADGRERDDAYRAAVASADRVDAVIATHAEAIERNVTAALLVQPLTKWHKGESVRTGWRASRSSILHVAGFERLGDLLAELATAGATIAGPDWRVDESNEAYRTVREEAAADARRRAEAYAAGLGATLGPVRWMAEPGLRGKGEPPYLGAAAPMARMAAMPDRAGGTEEVIAIAPEDLTIQAALEVSFGLV